MSPALVTPIVAGLDGGGSRTRLVLVDPAGAELSRVEGPATALDGTRSAEQTAQVIEGLMAQAAGAAAVELPLAGLWCGLAGASRTDLRAQLTDRLDRGQKALAVEIGSDADAAFAHAFAPRDPAAGPPHPPALEVLLIAGTGSIVITRGASGQSIRVGGWGPRFSDEGSGYWLGREAIALLLPLLERGLPVPTWARYTGPTAPASPPASAVELATWANAADRRTIAELASHVLAEAQLRSAHAAAATSLDPADQLIYRAVAALLELMDRAIALAAPDSMVPDSMAPEPMVPEPGEPYPVASVHLALAGGLLAPGRPLRQRLEHALAERTGAGQEPIRIVPTEIDAALGAANLAQQLVTHEVRRPR